MTQDVLSRALEELTEIQRRAVDWEDGAMLVLAGPGSGKTQVLTCRIARLLNSSRDKSFRILALTFTNKAADEMKARVANLVPGLEERASIGTFHSFCAQLLRQHGIHVGIKPDFTIYSLDEDRRAILDDALHRAPSNGQPGSAENVRYLGLIDRMKARLIAPEDASTFLATSADSAQIILTYKLYEQELRRLNALDFNSLILEAYVLAKTTPALAARYRRSYPFWLVDEFQDTNEAQYRLIKALAGSESRNLFVVADDDQIIYQWNGASYRHIQSFLTDFSADLIQFPTNYRCPPAIVEAANRLVVYNIQRTREKQPLIAGKTVLKLPEEKHIQLREFPTDEDEANGIAGEIARRPREELNEVRVLARTRALLDRVLLALRKNQIPAIIAQRRDDFLSAELRWLVACLKQVVRPLDRRNVIVLVEAFNRIGNTEVNADEVIAESEASGRSYLMTWRDQALRAAATTGTDLINLISRLAENPTLANNLITEILAEFEKRRKSSSPSGDESDLAEDLMAWREIAHEIHSHIGHAAPLDQFLQQLELRSKEPSPKPGTVTLMTVHGAKGGEFDWVYLIGLAEDVMPSFQSLQKGDKSPEMEEERRNCFVAITRAKECLILSRAARYKGWQKAPSRFLVEMGLAK